MAWTKGQSGNPSGRLSEGKSDIRALARRYTRTAINALVKVAKSGDKDSARVAAAIALLNRGYGPADVPPLQEVPDDILRAEVQRRAQLERAGDDVDASPAPPH